MKNMFLTPKDGFWTSFRWSEKKKTFLPVPGEPGDPRFHIFPPTADVVAARYGEIRGYPSSGRLDFSGVHRLVWGEGTKLGDDAIVRKVENCPANMQPQIELTQAIARVVREELGIDAPLIETDSENPADPKLPAEGNFASP